MAYFTKQEVRNYARRSVTASLESYSRKLESIVESQNYQRQFDVFLSHSIQDEELVLGIVELLKQMGKKVYVDWIEDRQLSRSSVTPETAETLRQRMNQSSRLLYLATNNSSSSKWMPWELGYFDGLKSGKVAILPLVDFAYSSFQGQEYLGLYPALDKDGLKRFLD
ncbi:TPA: toll/interleukin-1 receptor domain-containing protein [Pasteurella multocida]|uniref:toll/interleukin-1 receptor domain-containing protein n=1 Tax=Pasteurella multocida TaxID=747 RepID=UPI002931C046|nr:toll/interleukin-1 receptor domain-containing protein [Pasteurella multocida]WNY76408.1 toll/interleukin-1 receptor domain-containing protein [Pasteurella multocida]HDR1845490.1 toll/interleukin-1 receptor domain-containing protein [Pasteurella multocida]